MKTYPSIPKDISTDYNIYAFDKLDGSNIRAEWSKKRGFYKFGTKTQMLGEDHPVFGEAIPLIRSSYEKDLTDIFKEKKYDNVVCFFELHGPNSFAGYHEKESHKVTLLDVSPLRKGIIGPTEFIDDYGHLDIPKVLYYGKANSFFVDQVRSGTLAGMTFEGVICKASTGKNTVMFKVKNKAWLDKLKIKCKDDEKLFEQLA
ncbi:MAG TPA: hypothetical protein VM577_11565 [Anaerovoracaceae bacterium]|nr:hypothetical protein [Anaerovoracaceae bacterium]